jgi:hypothetical protein
LYFGQCKVNPTNLNVVKMNPHLRNHTVWHGTFRRSQ